MASMDRTKKRMKKEIQSPKPQPPNSKDQILLRFGIWGLGLWTFFILSFAFYLLPFTLCSQDIHFSQYNASPFNLNPALTGAFDGAFRFVGNERRQWASVTVPYQTFGFSADARNFLNSKLHTGISVYTDKAGDSQFGTLQIGMSCAYSLSLNADSTQRLSMGLFPVFTQRKINYSKLQFDSQYNGRQYDVSLGNNENFSITNRSYFNAASGILWSYKIAERKNIVAGISFYNLVKPKQSFFNDNQIKLDRRFNFHTTAQIFLNEKIDLLPGILFTQQGKFNEIDIGSAVKYVLDGKPFHYRALYAGIWTRAKDAGFGTVGMDYDNLNVGLSYDINYSKLRPASKMRGGLEISVIYIIRYLPPKREMHKICPDFL